MKYKYCHECGNKLIQKEIGDEGLIPFCVNCNIPFFDSPKSCTITAVLNENNEVALLKQNYISTTQWVLVAGYIKSGETLEESAMREIKEETGQIVNDLRYVRSYYYPKKDLIMAGFIAFVNKKEFGSSKEVDDIKWFQINDAEKYIKTVDNVSGIHFRNVQDLLRERNDSGK